MRSRHWCYHIGERSLSHEKQTTGCGGTLETVQGKGRRAARERDMEKGSSSPDFQSQGKTENACNFLKSQKVNHHVGSYPQPKSWDRLVLAEKLC